MSTAQLFLLCTAIWGTTWIAITFQLGVVDVPASIAYRFAIASALLFAYVRVRGLWRPQCLVDHLTAALMAAFFAVNYGLVYFAEGALPSGLVAVSSATIFFFNIVLARVLFGTRVTPALAAACVVGIAGVVCVYADEVFGASLEGRGLAALGALIGAFLSSCANMAAQKLGARGVPVLVTNTLWMFYVTLFMCLFVVVTPATFAFSFTPGYVLSLLYLALFGSLVAFGAFFTLLGRVGAGPAGYVAVTTPVIALVVSSFVEDLSWPWTRVLGVACILVGQVALLRARSKVPNA